MFLSHVSCTSGADVCLLTMVVDGWSARGFLSFFHSPRMKFTLAVAFFPAARAAGKNDIPYIVFQDMPAAANVAAVINGRAGDLPAADLCIGVFKLFQLFDMNRVFDGVSIDYFPNSRPNCKSIPPAHEIDELIIQAMALRNFNPNILWVDRQNKLGLGDRIQKHKGTRSILHQVRAIGARAFFTHASRKYLRKKKFNVHRTR